MIDRDAFFPAVRNTVFGGMLHQAQVDGINTILDEWQARKPDGDLRWLAYIFGTVVRETAGTMQPVREAFWLSENWRKENLRYYPYYGRGYVQLTWMANYRSMAAHLGVDLLNNPDKAMDPKLAAEIMFYGMEHGSFTGVGLPNVFNDTTEDWVRARTIINGLDHAGEIAGVARKFYFALAPERVAA